MLALLLALLLSLNSGEEQYYRGIYDVCVYYGLKTDKEREFVQQACLDYVHVIHQRKWYEKASKGWQWPIKDSEEQ